MLVSHRETSCLPTPCIQASEVIARLKVLEQRMLRAGLTLRNTPYARLAGTLSCHSDAPSKNSRLAWPELLMLPAKQ